jgi:hypothetical protein
MNHNSSFDMKTKGNRSPNIGHGFNRQFAKLGAHALPEESFAATFGSLGIQGVDIELAENGE